MDTTGDSGDFGDSDKETDSKSGKGKGQVLEASFPRGGIVTARGTGEGLIIRLDSRAQAGELQGALEDFLNSRKGFIQGNGVFVEWIGGPADTLLKSRVQKIITEQFGIKILESRSKAQEGSLDDTPSGIAPMKNSDSFYSEPSDEISISESSSIGLFDGMQQDSGDSAAGLRRELSAADSTAYESDSVRGEVWDDPDARIVYGMLRSGQKIETEHSVIICGDVNSGADIVAGGDIIILGTLRGVAHAGAYDETGGGRFIFALDLKATQLRIGTIISRGSDGKSVGPEIARIQGNNIMVEIYKSRVSPRSL